MAHLSAILAIALTALAAGCLDSGGDPATDSSDDLAADLDQAGGSSHGQASVTSTQELGSAKGSTVAPARYPFTVTVPAEGAKNVRWTMTVETTSNSVLDRVEGPGCTGTGMVVTVAGTSTFGGKCDELAPGEHQFTAILDFPAVTFTATVEGQVTVVNEW